MSERTLRRRLATRGTSYQQVLDELRSELACLEEPVAERVPQEPAESLRQYVNCSDRAGV